MSTIDDFPFNTELFDSVIKEGLGDSKEENYLLGRLIEEYVPSASFNWNPDYPINAIDTLRCMGIKIGKEGFGKYSGFCKASFPKPYRFKRQQGEILLVNGYSAPIAGFRYFDGVYQMGIMPAMDIRVYETSRPEMRLIDVGVALFFKGSEMYVFDSIKSDELFFFLYGVRARV